MKAIIVYYSATGNTKKVARAIRQGVEDVLGECDIAAVKEANPQDMAKYDLIGIGGPIWWYRNTANLHLFIYNMPQTEGKLCFPFCVHGAAPDGFFFTIAPALQRKGLTIIGYNDWYGSVYQCTHMPKPYLTDGHPDEIDLKEAADFGREMAERAGRINAGETGLIPELPKGAKAPPLWRPPSPPMEVPYAGSMPKLRRKINVDKCLYPDCTICMDNCPMHGIDLSVNPPVFRACVPRHGCSLCERLCPTGAVELEEGIARPQLDKVINMEKCIYPECTLCVDHCPMDAIDFSVNPPVFKSNCERDDLCWVICPQGAIEYVGIENMPYAMGELRENHPFVKYLNEEAAEGRFRWLVSLDEIGWENPIFRMQHHPRANIQELLKED